MFTENLRDISGLQLAFEELTLLESKLIDIRTCLGCRLYHLSSYTLETS